MMGKMYAKLIVLTFIVGVISLAGCDKSEPINLEAGSTDGFWLNVGNNIIVPTSDIDFYDVSTHMIYLKKKLPYLEELGYDSGMMTVNVGKEEIYQCPYHSLLSSSLPQGAYISTPAFNKEDIIRINFMQFFDANYRPTVKDPRNDKRIIAALKKYRQYHEGLHCALTSFNYSNGTLVFNFELYNSDTFNYYYLDPDKMGFGLFHYFTNGPSFYDLTNYKSYTHQETVIHPEPWNLWEKEWLTLIQSGERKKISITYNRFETIPTGNYRMCFEFPGLNNGISQKDLILKDGRIWMGNVNIEKDISIRSSI